LRNALYKFKTYLLVTCALNPYLVIDIIHSCMMPLTIPGRWLGKPP